MFCANANYYLKLKNGNYSRIAISFKVLRFRYSLETIKRFLINRHIVINYCGKCSFCLNLKKQNYKKRVRAQLKICKYSYLITLTFDNNNIFTLLNDQEKSNLKSLSFYSNLSKIQINNIIKNWKNKINRFYGKKVKLHYFLCGEYGENTKRAHYHILLMLDFPLPNLVRENVSGNHYKSSIINSKQYSLYDIQPTNSNISCASYISKYLSKLNGSYNYNYNYFQESLIYMYKKENIDLASSYVFKNKKAFISFIVYFLLIPKYRIFFNWWFINQFNLLTNVITTQKPFIKKSSKLGISDNLYKNYINGVLNTYYLSKFELLSFVVDNLIRKCLSICLYDFNLLFYFLYLKLYYMIMFKLIENRRSINIIKYFYKNYSITSNIYKNNDIL